MRVIQGIRCLSAAVLALCLLACGTSTTPSTQSSQPAAAPSGPVLRVGLTPDYPPLVYREAGQLKGLEVDLAGALGEALGRPVEFVPMAWQQLVPALQRKDIDVIMSGVSVTPEREEQVAFTDSYLTVGQMVIIRVRDAARYRSPLQALTGNARVGYVVDTTGAEFVLAEGLIRNKRAFDSVKPALEALKAGDIDLFIHDAPTSWDLAVSEYANDLMSLYRPLTEEQLAWAVHKDDTALRAELNRALQSLRQSGYLELALYRWIPVQVELQQ